MQDLLAGLDSRDKKVMLRSEFMTFGGTFEDFHSH